MNLTKIKEIEVQIASQPENEEDYREEVLSTHIQSLYRKNGSSWPDPNAIPETSVAVTNEDLSSVEIGQVTKEDTTQSNQEKSSQENYSESERADP